MKLTMKVDMPKPKEFQGSRSTRNMDNFFFGMERHLKAIGIRDDVVKVRIATNHVLSKYCNAMVAF